MSKNQFGIEITDSDRETAAFWRGIWVYAEQKNGEPANVALELLGEGRRLAEKLDVPLTTVLLGDDVEPLAKALIAHGADLVYLVEHASLRDFNDESYTAVVVQLIEEHKPEIVLFGATTFGRSLAPRVAARLKTGLIADCTSLDLDEQERILLPTRPAYSGSLMATVACPVCRPQLTTVRPKTMKALAPDSSRSGTITRPNVTIPENLNLNVIEVVTNLDEMISLADADVIVSGGRGLGDPQNFNLIQDLAKTLGGAVGATRAAVDAGWIAYNHQVGQTGKTVKPKVYFACGISGADQHLAGMQSSDIIIAINKDPEAPIFKVATYGLVGDLFQILPALTKAFKEKLS